MGCSGPILAGALKPLVIWRDLANRGMYKMLNEIVEIGAFIGVLPQQSQKCPVERPISRRHRYALYQLYQTNLSILSKRTLLCASDCSYHQTQRSDWHLLNFSKHPALRITQRHQTLICKALKMDRWARAKHAYLVNHSRSLALHLPKTLCNTRIQLQSWRPIGPEIEGHRSDVTISLIQYIQCGPRLFKFVICHLGQGWSQFFGTFIDSSACSIWDSIKRKNMETALIALFKAWLPTNCI